jgi:hypothetical protein
MEFEQMEFLQMKIVNTIFICMTGLLVSVPIKAHDTTHIHPLISAKISDLIELTDAGVDVYEELYRDLPVAEQDPLNPARQRLYWGTDFDPAGMNKAIAEGRPLSEYLVKDQFDDYTRNNNVIDGVVYEDRPATKVINHFYQANSGNPLTLSVLGALGENSETRAMRFFNQSISKMYEYTNKSKQEAFFLFGQALHHLEDMTSPAHVHNDAHLTLDMIVTNIDSDKDDYEGWWLPQQKIVDANLSAYFAGATSITPVTNPWVDIWGKTAADNSLVQKTWATTTYNAILQFNFSVFLETAGSYDYYTHAQPPSELPQMFALIMLSGVYA